MFNDYSAIEKNIDNIDKKTKKRNEAGRSLNRYIDQLKFHFELTDNDVLSVLNLIIKNRKENSSKKWWQLWK
ncbi:MAG: hypothetical protein WCK67_07455 [bacterium]